MFVCQEVWQHQNRIPLTLAITSPAHRPIQTTKDLPAFWAGSWREVAKEMRGRYPKHPWPDDPASASATLRTKKAGGSPRAMTVARIVEADRKATQSGKSRHRPLAAGIRAQSGAAARSADRLERQRRHAHAGPPELQDQGRRHRLCRQAGLRISRRAGCAGQPEDPGLCGQFPLGLSPSPFRQERPHHRLQVAVVAREDIARAGDFEMGQQGLAVPIMQRIAGRVGNDQRTAVGMLRIDRIKVERHLRRRRRRDDQRLAGEARGDRPMHMAGDQADDLLGRADDRLQPLHPLLVGKRAHPFDARCRPADGGAR